MRALIAQLRHFDDNDNLLTIELITEPAQVVRYSTVHDAAMHHAVPYQQFAAQMVTAE
ncbi:hypothetical protein GCM10010094_00640 [Streptomyces flaveus]|uniref:DUF6879 domain-containing protein n=1 Tax=Streptomyces flaveus TaxID=66370 RepID=A0A917V623_9ACTN|nr:DUF6879 family protein [Streptomyces flaveus]GGK44820.1 hypothetical protein GCM10010094_00640 [Streptomyces flaveus]